MRAIAKPTQAAYALYQAARAAAKMSIQVNIANSIRIPSTAETELRLYDVAIYTDAGTPAAVRAAAKHECMMFCASSTPLYATKRCADTLALEARGRLYFLLSDVDSRTAAARWKYEHSRATPAPTSLTCAEPNLPAAVIGSAEAETPVLARQQGISGEVQVRVSLDAASTVVGVQILSSPSKILNAAALAIARTAKFRTEIVHCRPVSTDVQFRVAFPPPDSSDTR
jgi:TonB family protein